MMNARHALIGSLSALLLAATPVQASDPHDIIGGLIGLGIIANVLDNHDEHHVTRVEHRYEYRDQDYAYGDGYGESYSYEPPRYHHTRHYQHARIGGREARELCERALHREKSNYALRDIDNFDYDRRRGQYSMLLEARKHGHGKYRSYWCEVDAYSGRVYLDRSH
ncbi:MAG: hypothetical protein HYV16_00075 [Gammaproteobacteria bacterium]|nr:hypothetical protein [Gammaproteobacteria bacterium]